MLLLTVGALGVVFGDIGTSPLYAFRETFEGHDIAVTPTNVVGACSLVLWSLVLVVSIKYLVFILRADNRGEGGILALTELVVGKDKARGRLWVLLMVGLFGMALLYGDGVITPAISVLSAVEGLKITAPALSDWVIPLAVGILIGLFAMQRRGTGAVGALFGPVMLVWFATLAALGLFRISGNFDVLEALNPVHGVQFLLDNGFDGFLSLGSVFLVVTGGEALYADLGHFGRTPIRWGWFTIAFPALVINYFGQGALLLAEPEAIESPVFNMGPEWARWPLVILATCATVIASQALISGAYSMTVQAMHLDYLPRLNVRHTSASHAGQVYLPTVNWLLALGCISLVMAFGSSADLAAAYGIAVTATMAITTLLFFWLTRTRWGWSTLKALAVCVPFAVLDLAFFSANVFKIPSGGWFPLVVGSAIMLLMTTWRTGRAAVAERLDADLRPIGEFIARLPDDVVRVPGVAAFMYRRPGYAPPALRTNTRHNRALHSTVLLVSVEVDPEAYLDGREVEVSPLGNGCFQVSIRHGYMEEANVPRALDGLQVGDHRIAIKEVTFFLGRETVISTPQPTMSRWRERLFAIQLRSSASASRFFDLPSDQVVEVGSQVTI
jgi:KUP system potassium uptake protein